MTIVDSFHCQECGMRVGANEFHPHLYCVLYKQYMGNPETLLKEYGFVKTEKLDELKDKIRELSQSIPPGSLNDDQNALFDKILGKVERES